ncbi:glycosyltransferase [Chitinimonas sp. BJB300]|uniref:glycosyltransferase n=1 Tax=Chitinimonas sp. BJB300 TaxID=1559339 RepID=UPI000C0F7504|nr:glycosyltransferase [Chitinimonas sp. BJB300]PHV11193.1 glycosyl transferase [Chitinimonas sp. BJB300]TSJ89030.1 glycosyltransferase [Chitinimonas sp. BJB300]
MERQAPPTHIDVSVIVPVFNCAQYLVELLESLCAQVHCSLEIIAVNDGSTDESLAILERYSRLDPRIVIVTQENLGLSAARNTGIQLARGDWIAFADGDDWLAPDALHTWCKEGLEKKLDVVIGNGFRFDTCPTQVLTNPICSWKPSEAVISGEDWVIQSVAQRQWKHYAWLQLIRRSLVVENDLRFQVGMFHEDILWTTHLAACAKRIGFCDAPFYGYRISPTSITNTASQDTIVRRVRSYIAIVDGLSNATSWSHLSPRFRKALLRQANIEAGHLTGLLRNHTLPLSHQPPVAEFTLIRKLIAPVFKGATTASEVWRAVRFWRTVFRIFPK